MNLKFPAKYKMQIQVMEIVSQNISKYKDIEKISENAILYVKENNSLENLIESEYKSMIKLK